MGLGIPPNMPVGIDIIRQLVPGKKTYIGQLEALAAAIVLETLPSHILQDRAAIFWIDNLSLSMACIKDTLRLRTPAGLLTLYPPWSSRRGLGSPHP